MRNVWIRRRPDGVTELSPSLEAMEPEERWLVIVTFVLGAGGLFMAGLMPTAALGAVIASSLAGEVVLGAKAVFLALRRPLAEVHDVPSFHRRRSVR